MSTNANPSTDVLIIGSGAAGLSLALRLPTSCSVTLISKGPIASGSTFYAQGGISAVLGEDDSVEAHVNDTLLAGAGLCDPKAVNYVVERGPEAIAWLVNQGANFTQDPEHPGHLHLTREGGHSKRRVIHADDATGREVETSLESAVRARPNIHLLETHMAVDLITATRLGETEQRCVGAYILNIKSGHVLSMPARTVVLATGGANLAYLYTSNPHGSSGDGIAMAWRAGCRVGNMEFMQFHPTCLFDPKAGSFLISEALRGEGALLKRPDGTQFMAEYHKLAELAPRDIVARAIDHEMKRLGADHMWLDISHKPGAFIREHFPMIRQRCLELGHDMTTDPLPVVPAAHYTCGGVVTDLHGRSDIPGLYAIGETAFTGLHGANRMASNSILECLVFAQAAGDQIPDWLADCPPPPSLPAWDESQVTDSDEEVIVSHNWQEVRRAMWDYVGIVRTDKRLERAYHRIRLLRDEINEYYGNFRITPDLIELRNLSKVAELIILCAQQRKESRGLHFTLDYPDLLYQPANTLLESARYDPQHAAAAAEASS